MQSAGEERGCLWGAEGSNLPQGETQESHKHCNLSPKGVWLQEVETPNSVQVKKRNRVPLQKAVLLKLE